MDKPNFTPRQESVIKLLTQGKINKEIALALGLSERTVEDHLKNIYGMLGVSSRTEAIIKLVQWYISPSNEINQAGKSTVGEISDPAVVSTVVIDKTPAYNLIQWATNRRFQISAFLIFAAVAITIIILYLRPKDTPYQREAEFPDNFTTGTIIDRSNALGTKVHGQFGSQSTSPWSALPGYVLYNNINILQSGPLYLQIRYSKFSKSSVPIQIYIDEESTPRESIYPIDQGDWNKFIWTEWIALGEITKGSHSIKFFTNGQEFGVADLDQFILTTEPP